MSHTVNVDVVVVTFVVVVTVVLATIIHCYLIPYIHHYIEIHTKPIHATVAKIINTVTVTIFEFRGLLLFLCTIGRRKIEIKNKNNEA